MKERFAFIRTGGLAILFVVKKSKREALPGTHSHGTSELTSVYNTCFMKIFRLRKKFGFICTGRTKVFDSTKKYSKHIVIC